MSDIEPRPGAAARAMWEPASTYRLQFSQQFTFEQARAAAPYLARLGVSACYASPFFTARRGSPHGYDVCDHNALNPELGTPDEYRAYAAAVAGAGMGQVLDFVPNHMGNDPQTNPWWRDVLESGPSSRFGRFFDIDWTPLKSELFNKVLLPVLGDQYGRVLERGELRLGFQDGAFLLDYFDLRLPINPRQSTRALRHGLDELRAGLGEESPELRELLSIISALHNMPAYTETDPAAIEERQREKEVQRERLKRLCAESAPVRAHVERAVAALNGQPGHPESFDALHELLEAQAYRLSYWRTASHEINYRRFFDINDLAGLRIEDPEVFAATHRLLRQLLSDGSVQGLRIDHPDGLFDPGEYFTRLQALARETCGEAGGRLPIYLVAEKILSEHEELPAMWEVHGTTGYNYLNVLNGLFVDSRHGRALRRQYSRFTGREEPYSEVAYEGKKLIMETAMASELNVLAQALNRLSERNRRSRDFTLNSLRDVLVEIVACFPVYRTYITPSGWSARDRETIETAVRLARRRNPAMETSIFDFVREMLLPRRPLPPGERPADDRRDGYMPTDEEDYQRRVRFAMRFQQYTGPVQAKGIEDTAFYRYNVLLSLNEVGGEPAVMGRAVEDFHAMSRARLERWPLEMIATATHDTKLGEDTRARINVLSELAEDWRRDVARWSRINQPNRTLVDGEMAPDRNDEYRFYQVLLGVWPAGVPADAAAAPQDLVDRLVEYMRKATKEAKLYTSWISDNQEYDAATERFVTRALSGATFPRFRAALAPLQAQVARAGFVNSLAQLAMKLVSPGVPDFYQGTEFWAYTLVDPDNRRPVDFDARVAALDALEPLLPRPDGTIPDGSRAPDVAALLAAPDEGHVKLLVTAAGLRLRRARPDLFLRGDYLPLTTETSVEASLVACARIEEGQAVLGIAPRLVARLVTAEQPVPIGTMWMTSRVLLPEPLRGRTWRNALTGEAVKPASSGGEEWLFVGDALRTMPVALLIADA